MFWDAVQSLSKHEQSQLLLFWSGSPLPPLSGFKPDQDRVSNWCGLIWTPLISPGHHPDNSLIPQENVFNIEFRSHPRGHLPSASVW